MVKTKAGSPKPKQILDQKQLGPAEAREVQFPHTPMNFVNSALDNISCWRNPVETELINHIKP